MPSECDKQSFSLCVRLIYLEHSLEVQRWSCLVGKSDPAGHRVEWARFVCNVMVTRFLKLYNNNGCSSSWGHNCPNKVLLNCFFFGGGFCSVATNLLIKTMKSATDGCWLKKVLEEPMRPKHPLIEVPGLHPDSKGPTLGGPVGYSVFIFIISKNHKPVSPPLL